MKTIRTLATAAIIALTFSASVHAQTEAATAAASTTEGEVRKIDKTQGKVTLRHGPIDNLGMPGMTMVFKAAAPQMLDRFQVGDKVRFTAEKVDGTLTVTTMEAAK